MTVSLFSRYRKLTVLEIRHATRGATRSLPVRRLPAVTTGGRAHRFSGVDTADLLARKYFGREELYWHLLDANRGRLPESFVAGEKLVIPPIEQATRIERPGP